MYWCAASPPDGNGEQIATRWKSLMGYICDNHEGCYHLPLGQMERRRKWFIPGKECTPIQMHLYYCKFKQPYNYSCYTYVQINRH